ncbi:hypothetical protein [Mesorhizobium sp. M0847]|uniref:hypothetical protein n=1 Tax=unclassified Mesorhizobium TaxID=325217 RepID=UPI00333E0FA4
MTGTSGKPSGLVRPFGATTIHFHNQFEDTFKLALISSAGMPAFSAAVINWSFQVANRDGVSPRHNGQLFGYPVIEKLQATDAHP